MQFRSTSWFFQRCRNAHLSAPKLLARTFATPAQYRASKPELYDVVCVGGGPAGLSLIAGLRASPATSGLKVALIEGQDLAKNQIKNDSPTAYSNRCSSLTPASVNFLKDIGVWNRIDHTRIQPYDGMIVWDGLSDSRISFDWAETTFSRQQPNTTSHTIAFMIENLNLTTALQNHLKSLGGTTIYSPARVEDISFGEETEDLDLSSWPVVSLSNGQSLAARLLVGADGANSPVRMFAGIDSRGWDYNRMGVVATLQLEGPGRGGAEHKIAYQRFLPSGPVAMLPLPGNMASLVWSTLPERAAKLKSLNAEDFCAVVNAAFRLSAVDLAYLHTMDGGQKEEVNWREKHTKFDEAKVPMKVVAVQEGSVAPFPLKMRHADTYISERIALVGDAAHTINPLAGQGLNQGQGDVASLLRTITAAVESGQDIGSQLALEQYSSERYAANNALLGVCDKLHKLYSFESAPVVWARSLGLSAVDSLGFVKGFLMKRAAGGV